MSYQRTTATQRKGAERAKDQTRMVYQSTDIFAERAEGGGQIFKRRLPPAKRTFAKVKYKVLRAILEEAELERQDAAT